MPPHFDDGGHLPFGGTIGNTRGPSAFGRRKATRANAIGNPQALLLNYPPENGPAQLACWERNYKSSIYMDASAEEGRMVSSNFSSFGKPMVPSYLAQSQQTWGNLRRTAFTRPTPSPAFYPPPRDSTPEQVAAADYNGKWPARDPRAAQPQIKRPDKVETASFLEEYELRPPWLKY